MDPTETTRKTYCRACGGRAPFHYKGCAAAAADELDRANSGDASCHCGDPNNDDYVHFADGRPCSSLSRVDL